MSCLNHFLKFSGHFIVDCLVVDTICMCALLRFICLSVNLFDCLPRSCAMGLNSTKRLMRCTKVKYGCGSNFDHRFLSAIVLVALQQRWSSNVQCSLAAARSLRSPRLLAFALWSSAQCWPKQLDRRNIASLKCGSVSSPSQLLSALTSETSQYRLQRNYPNRHNTRLHAHSSQFVCTMRLERYTQLTV